MEFLMVGFQGEEEFYMKIQNNLFELIPESWKKILLHVSIIDIPNQRPKGEVYIYYIPKGLLKRKPVNCYEIPALYDIDEEEYLRLITSLYNIIKLLRDNYKAYRKKAWSTVDIECTQNEFLVKYGFEKLEALEYSPEERHIIWRYENLDLDLDSLSKKERKILDYYIKTSNVSLPKEEEICKTEIYERPASSQVDYERSLTLEEIIARDKEAARLEEKRQKKLMKKKRKKQLDILEDDDTEDVISNQILK
jgi:hypothetical protein